MSTEYEHLNSPGARGNRKKLFIIVGSIVCSLVVVAIIAMIIGLAVGLKKDDDDDYVDISNNVNIDNIMNHLKALQNLAYANNGTRAAGTPGYNASVDYVYTKLRQVGYEPTLQTFPITTSLLAPSAPTPTLVAVKTGGKITSYTYRTDFTYAQGSGSGPVENTAVFAVPNYGCDASDYTTGWVIGQVALISRSPLNNTFPANCTFTQKVDLAATQGASGVIIFNNGVGSQADPRTGLFTIRLEKTFSIPVFSSTFLLSEHLTCSGASTVTMTVQTQTTTYEVSNVCAEPTAGNFANTIIIGAHLDSVPAGPGINDDGSGSATVLEIALQTAYAGWGRVASPNRIRFCWWAAEELGLLGSINYVANTNLSQIAAYLNFDMIGSPNYVRGVLNGSTAEGSASEGCSIIQGMFEDDIENANVGPSEPTTFGPPYRSDYGPFVAAGIPAGGLFTGAEVVKDGEQRQKYGGLAGASFDPCYHLSCDTVDNINQEILGQFSKTATRIMQKLASMRDVRGYLSSNNTESEPVNWEQFRSTKTFLKDLLQ